MSGAASAQQPKPFLDTIDPRHQVVRAFFRDNAAYGMFRYQLGRLRDAHGISIAVITVPDIGAGDSIARVFHESFDKAAYDIAALRPEYQKTNVLMIALSARPPIFAIDGGGTVKDRLILNGTNYSPRLRNLQLRAIVTPTEAIHELPLVLAEELKAPNDRIGLPLLEQQAIKAVEDSFYGIALPRRLERWLFSAAQVVVLWLQSAFAWTGWLLFGAFCAVICAARILSILLARFVEGIERRYGDMYLGKTGIDSHHARRFIVRKLFEKVLEFAFALTIINFLMTAAFGDLLSILTISQMTHHDFGRIFALTQQASNLSSTPPLWLVLAAMAVALAGISILLLELAAAFRLSFKYLQHRHYLIAAAIAGLAALVAWLVLPLIARLPVLLVLKGSVAWVVIGTVAVWTLFELWDIRDALARRLLSRRKQAAA
jgi:hypothetical protein